jgi:hypothetical protein
MHGRSMPWYGPRTVYLGRRQEPVEHVLGLEIQAGVVAHSTIQPGLEHRADRLGGKETAEYSINQRVIANMALMADLGVVEARDPRRHNGVRRPGAVPRALLRGEGRAIGARDGGGANKKGSFLMQPVKIRRRPGATCSIGTCLQRGSCWRTTGSW